MIGRYAVYEEIGAGGMATVHFGRLVGSGGFWRIVAVKRLHPHLATDPSHRRMLLGEARLAARLHHPNVVPTLDVMTWGGDVYVVMEYVPGVSLSLLMQRARARGELIDPRIAAAVVLNVLRGLHAAHEAVDERKQPLGIVHRDVSPQNVLAGADGHARVLDFGVAKSAAWGPATNRGQMKGKFSYMAPEQLRGSGVDRRADVFAASILLWELLTGERLFSGANDGEILFKIAEHTPVPPSTVASVAGRLGPAFDDVVLRGLEWDRERRFPTAHAMALELERLPLAPASEVGAWVSSLAGDVLDARAARVSEIESQPLDDETTVPSRSLPEGVVDLRRAGRRRFGMAMVAGVVAWGAAVLFSRAWSQAARASTGGDRGLPAVATPVNLAEPTLGPSAAAVAPVPAPSALPSPSVSAPPGAAPGRCAPPFFTDARGLKQYKPDCL